MELFIASLIVVTVALLTSSSRLALRMRRSRLLTLLSSGGWIPLGAGVLIQFAGRDLSLGEMLLDARPLIVTALGWIGLMVGMQARRDVLRSLPLRVWKMAVVDAIVSFVVLGMFAYVMLLLWSGNPFGNATLGIIVPALMLAAGGIGWSLETRSLASNQCVLDEQASILLRACGSLGVIFAISIFGITELFAGLSNHGAWSFDPLGVLRNAATILALAISMGFIGRYGLRFAGRNRPEQLAVFLGLVAFVAGIASQLDISPLFAAMLTGVVIANLAGKDLRIFERFIYQAEPVVGAVFALLAGLLMKIEIGLIEIGIALGIVALRAIIKPMLFKALGRDHGTPMKGWESIAPIRQGRLAIALGVSLFLVVPSDLTARLITIIVIAGLACDLLTMAIMRASESNEQEAPAQPEGVTR